MTVLITGGSGLLAVNWATFIRDNRSVCLGIHHKNITLTGVESEHVSLETVEGVQRAIERVDPSIVIHTAGLTSVEQCEESPDLAQHVNVHLAESVARACAKMGVRLVHISTDHLFDGGHGFVDETMAVLPQNVYAATKAEAECRVLNALPEALIVRTNFYGWGTRYRRSFSDFIIDSLRRGERVCLFDDVFYTPLLIDSLVGAVHELLAKQAHGVFHVVGDERLSKYQFGEKVARVFGLNIDLLDRGTIKACQSLVRRPRDMSLANRKVRDLLGHGLGNLDTQLLTLLRQQECGSHREIISL